VNDLLNLAGVVPVLAVTSTAFVKFGVVLAILRRALGGNAVPPATVAFVLAAVFAVFVAAPVAERTYAATNALSGKATVAERWSAAAKPAADFFLAHTPKAEREAFVDLAKRLRPEAERASVTGTELSILAPAFCIAELKSAFQVGFFLYLPFLLIELLVSTILLALGMQRLQPEMVSLPFKLLLFVAVDGWHLLARGLLLGYA